MVKKILEFEANIGWSFGEASVAMSERRVQFPEWIWLLPKWAKTPLPVVPAPLGGIG